MLNLYIYLIMNLRLLRLLIKSTKLLRVNKLVFAIIKISLSYAFLIKKISVYY